MGEPPTVPLRARTAVGALAWRSVAAVSAAAARLAGAPPPEPDPHRIAVSYTSERWLEVDGAKPRAFAPLSGFFRASDGWVRTHANYPHHAGALRRALALSPAAGPADLEVALLRRSTTQAASAVAAEGGLCVEVRAESHELDASLKREALVRVERLADAPAAPLPRPSVASPLAGVRVLDLTRVIAGPVATRNLALLGADLLRVDSPRLPEIDWQHLDTGHGKRSTLLDLGDHRDRSRFDALLADADVIVTGYRAGALARLGLTPTRLAAGIADGRRGLVVARLSAWGDDRRGFDSLVQAASGISWLESSDGEAPGALPAQALDHSAGHLLAAEILRALERRARIGGSWLVETSLRRIAAELLGMPRADTSGASVDLVAHPTGHLQEFTVDGIALTTTAPALSYPGGPALYAPPRRWGGDAPGWR